MFFYLFFEKNGIIWLGDLMKYGKCEDCGVYVRYQEVPLCDSCREKAIERLNECARNGCKNLNDFLKNSGLNPRKVRYFVLNGFVDLQGQTEAVDQIKEEENKEKFENLYIAKELSKSFENASLKQDAPKGTVGVKSSSSSARMHFIDSKRR